MYAKLSHCWGPITSRVAQATSHNYDEHMNGIFISKLPQTFQDAIFLTNGLDVQYIWIDSLCIIQNSPSDWQQQSAMVIRLSKISAALKRIFCFCCGLVFDQEGKDLCDASELDLQSSRRLLSSIIFRVLDSPRQISRYQNLLFHQL